MKAANRFYLLSLVVLMVTLIAWGGGPNIIAFGKVITLKFVNLKELEQSKQAKDPCWFMSLKDKSIPYEEIKKREDREMHGYPAEVPLSEAVGIFNEEKQCSGLLAPYPLLTEDEIIAAIVGGPDYGKQGDIWIAQKDSLWKIASQKVMPKGSLLVAESGYRVQESPLRPSGTIEAKGIRITLLLGLDKNDEHAGNLKAEQAHVIRKTYSKVEIVR